MAAALGIAWQSGLMAEERSEAEEATESVGLGLYAPQRPRERPARLRGPFPLTEKTLRFLVASVRSYNGLLAEICKTVPMPSRSWW